MSLARAINVDVSPDDIEHAFRVGKFEEGKNTQLLVEFYRLKICKQILTNRGLLNSEEMKRTNLPCPFVFIH